MATVTQFNARAWRDQLQRSSTGAPKTNLFNACLAIRGDPAFRGALAFDEFFLQTRVLRPLPWNDDGDRFWDNHDDSKMTEWLQANDLNVGISLVPFAVENVAYEHRFHPVREWFDGLEWDGQLRLDTWLIDYLGVDPSPYVQAVGRAWLISAVARIMRPGCKADHVLILEGKQGLKKSTALRVLAGDDWFTDEIAELGSKDASMQSRGVLIIELGEMDHMTRGEVSRIKAFLSRAVDRFRPSFGARVISAPRECVFAGTVNHSEYLKDETGNRRFWPVRCQSIAIDALRHDREQLWAEAVAAYRAGEPWWIVDREIEAEAREEQAIRNEGDAWTPIVAGWIERYNRPIDFKGFYTHEILVDGIGKRQADITQPDRVRIGKIMRGLGYEMQPAKIAHRVERLWVKIVP